MNDHEPIEATEQLFTRTRSRGYRNWIRFGSYLLITGIFVFFLIVRQFDRFEDFVRDSFLKNIHWGQAHPAIALIEISETALNEIGPWPWPRSYYAIMVRLLDEWKAGAIVLDLDLSEPTDPKNDQDLVQSLARIQTPLYLPVDLKPRKEKKFWVHGLPVVLDDGVGRKDWVHALPDLEKKAQAIGHHYFEPDADGILRRFDLFLEEGKERHLLLPALIAFDWMKKTFPSAPIWKGREDAQKKILIPWSRDWDRGFARYNFSDLIHSFYSIQKGLRPVIDPGAVAGKICLVGGVASGNGEFKVTPFSSSYPGIEIDAQVLNAALTGNWIQFVPLWGNIACLLAAGCLAVIIFVMLGGAWPFVTGLLLVAGWFAFCFVMLAKWHLAFSAVYPGLLMLCLFIFSAIYVQAATTREKSHLFHLATRDGLTELYVIRHFRLIMNQVVREASVRKQVLSVVLLDIDNFKKINDTYGHPAGDMVLKKTAAIILSFIRKRRPFREIDFAARYGGEEFIIMLRKTGLREAAEVAAERIRKKIEETRFEWDGQPITVTVSMGVATLHSGENLPDAMVRRADAALYQAKGAGKNRVCMENK